ncbi:MAG: glycosyltransferase [Bacteroidales bacterium]
MRFKIRENKKTRIFLGISDIAGYMHSLNKGFEKNSVKSRFYDLTGSKFKYSDEKTSAIIKLHRFLVGRESNTYSVVLKKTYSISQLIIRFFLFIKCLFIYDVFIFCSYRTILHFHDLPVLKFFNKKIIFVFFGSDTRPAYISGNLIISNVLKDGKIDNLDFIYSDCLEKRKLIMKIEKYSDFIINHPPTSFFHKKSFILWSIIGFPFWDGKLKINPLFKEENTPAIRILHAPSNPLTKGSGIIEEAIERLKRKGYQIEFIKIFNRPNKEVLAEIAKCDFVIDELYSDIPLGGLGTEAAFFGKPTINGGYYFEFIKKDYPDSAIPPSVFCCPEEIEEAIDRLIRNTEFRKNIGEASKEFVSNNWESEKVAKRFLQLINKDFPASWYYDPSQSNYIFGYGQSKEQLKKVLEALLRKYGDQGLFLEDKPGVLQKIHKFVQF